MRKIILFILFIFLIFGIYNIYNSNKTKKIYINNNPYKVLLSDTDQKRINGLSFMQKMPTDTVMLFVFDTPSKLGFWMKDMNFPIDIIFLDENMKVINYFDNVKPETYPNVFYSESPAKYVIEMNAGQRETEKIDKGMEIYYK